MIEEDLSVCLRNERGKESDALVTREIVRARDSLVRVQPSILEHQPTSSSEEHQPRGTDDLFGRDRVTNLYW